MSIKKSSFIITNALLLITVTTLTAQAKTASEIYEQAAKSTVVVGNFDAKGKQQSMGSGVVMPDGDVVTNCHVVKGASRLTVRVGKTERPATLRFSDWDRDVCTLSSTGLNAPSATVGSSTTLKVGARVYAIGAPKGFELTLSDGIVSSLRELEGGRYIQTTAAISPGSSGGGLYDDNGALVGLTTFYFAEGQSLNFAVPIDWVKDLSKRSTKTQHTEKTTTTWMAKAIELETRKDWISMQAHCLQWVDAQPKSNIAWFSLAISHTKKQQFLLAVQAYQKAILINTEHAQSWSNLAGVYGDMQHYVKAIEAYQSALRLNPESAVLWYNLAVAYDNTKQYQKSINAYVQTLRISPESTNAWINLGSAYSDTKQYTKAIEAYQEVVRISPTDIDAWYNLGITHNDMKQYLEANKAYEQVLKLNPEHASAWYRLGSNYYLWGNYTKVVEVYKTLKVLDSKMASKYAATFMLKSN